MRDWLDGNNGGVVNESNDRRDRHCYHQVRALSGDIIGSDDSLTSGNGGDRSHTQVCSRRKLTKFIQRRDYWESKQTQNRVNTTRSLDLYTSMCWSHWQSREARFIPHKNTVKNTVPVLARLRAKVKERIKNIAYSAYIGPWLEKFWWLRWVPDLLPVHTAL